MPKPQGGIAGHQTVLGTDSAHTREGVAFRAYTSATAAPDTLPVHSFVHAATGTQIMTLAAAEITQLQESSAYQDQGIQFYALAAAATDTVAVVRYRDLHTGTHFFSANVAEQAVIAADRPDLQLEGIAFYAHGADWQ